MIEATENNFDGLLASDKPLVVDFGAEWCAPCKALAPMMAELAKTYADRITVTTCDVEENNDIAVRYSIRSVPTIIFFKNGREVDRQVGTVARTRLEEKIGALL